MLITFRILLCFERKSLEKRGSLEQGETQNLQDFGQRPVETQFAFHDCDQDGSLQIRPVCDRENATGR